ncbi:Transposase IS200 like protein [Gemmata obscuriglobus]|uniref:Transposase n=1 Tax=Gemmata obscuriglobus TaxID=114 RepID=A0A2Z3GTX6_9BACT|nr:transposase [Gemmata obscuriglobus]AWM36001.1 transposase [Gemmata obscuriglobus]QEG31429.1 Transposase IS200 like protein [Gemmata obscuriglobus]VTS10770.1 type i site-specific family : Uncharacterized protein OS=Chloracidobacterium thermophilum (strain B) GN=Cabther_A1201 PE=4 SV=1: Y1_Tnp [Gemmata obscuriglobus UQM 2246]
MGRTSNQNAEAHPRGWHSRGYLPHFDGGAALPQTVTFRLADSVPASVVTGWRDELTEHPEPEHERELRKRLDKYLDTGYGARHLLDTRIARLVEGALWYFDGVRYLLHAWVVMPNHVHALFTPLDGWSLSRVVASWKSFTAKEANKVLGRTGRFWHKDYFDRYVRNAEHFALAADYIECNPVKAGLCRAPGDWPFGSARFHSIAGAAGTAAVPGRNP